jgi:hypothetical protein
MTHYLKTLSCRSKKLLPDIARMTYEVYECRLETAYLSFHEGVVRMPDNRACNSEENCLRWGVK